MVAEKMFGMKRKSEDRQANQVRRSFKGRVSTHLNPSDLKKQELLSSQLRDDGSGLMRELGSNAGSVCQTPKVLPGSKLTNKFAPRNTGAADKASVKDSKGSGLIQNKFGVSRNKVAGTLSHAPSSATLKTDSSIP